MARHYKMKTSEMGDLNLYVIFAKDGDWGAWEPLKGSSVEGLVTIVTKEVFQHASRGWTQPLVQALGIPPVGALLKLPTEMKTCGVDKCPMRSTSCHVGAKKLPWCFVPGGVSSPEVQALAAEVINHWKSSVYVLVVLE